MAKKKNKKKQDDELLVDIVGAQAQAQGFLEKNQTVILGGLLAFVLIVGGWFAYQNLYQAPQEKEAKLQSYKAEQMFRSDSLDLALNNPGGGYPGFLDIAKKYSGTTAGNLANYYIGVIYMQKGNYQEAIDYLKKYSPEGSVTPAMTHGLIGDAQSELGDMEAALSQYKKAANSEDNEFTTPYYLFKTGMLLNRQGKADDAQKFFKRIKEDYPTSAQGTDIDRYLLKG